MRQPPTSHIFFKAYMSLLVDQEAYVKLYQGKDVSVPLKNIQVVKMEAYFKGKRALVTGAGKGFGRAVAKTLVSLGSETYAVSRTQEDLDSLKAEEPSINIINVDLQDWDKTREALCHIGPLDLLVNNAGIGRFKMFLDASEQDIDSVFDINFKAAFNVGQMVAKGMVENGISGSIVNMSSMMSTRSVPGGSIYSCTKAALDMLTRCMSLELGQHNIRVNSINPTVVWTNMTKPFEVHFKETLEQTPMKKFPEIEDVVNLVIYLLSDKSLMISGDNIRIDGGLCVH